MAALDHISGLRPSENSGKWQQARMSLGEHLDQVHLELVMVEY
jgi:hypothetical protein